MDKLVWQRREGRSSVYYTAETQLGRVRISRVNKFGVALFRAYYPDGTNFTGGSFEDTREQAETTICQMLGKAEPDMSNTRLAALRAEVAALLDDGVEDPPELCGRIAFHTLGGLDHYHDVPGYEPGLPLNEQRQHTQEFLWGFEDEAKLCRSNRKAA